MATRIQQPQHIIISRTDSIGDVVLTLPMCGWIRQQYPDCKLSFLGRSYTRPVVSASAHVDEFLDWDEFSGLESEAQAARIRALNADVWIHVFPEEAIAHAVKRAGVPHRIGARGRFFHLRTINHLVGFSRRWSGLHEAQLNFKLLKSLGFCGKVTREELAKYYDWSKLPELKPEWRQLLSPDRTNLILHPKSKGSAVEWGLANFRELIDRLPPDQYRIFITGIEEEGRQIRKGMSLEGAVDLTGKMSLGDLLAFIGAADALVSCSTGPLHLAAAMGKRAIGLYSQRRPIHPGRWAPLGDRAMALVYEGLGSSLLGRLDADVAIRMISPERVEKELRMEKG